MLLDNQVEVLYKLGAVEPTEHVWSAGKVFALEVRAGTTNLCISANGMSTNILRVLIEQMTEPMWLLYVLVVSRGEGAEGRYQSAEPITKDEAKTFLERFHTYLEVDGRYNLWLKSVEGPCLIVSDRHDFVYAYGAIDIWVGELKAIGWTLVERDSIWPPVPHSHHYHAMFDDDARNVLSSREWEFSPLREQDQ